MGNESAFGDDVLYTFGCLGSFACGDDEGISRGRKEALYPVGFLRFQLAAQHFWIVQR